MTTKKPKEQCYIFGRGIEEFTIDEFPTIADVMRNYFYVKQNVTRYDNEIRKIVIDRLVKHFKTIDPTAELLNEITIYRKIKKFHEKKKNLEKNKKNKKSETNINNFRKSCSAIFEIRKIQKAPKEVSIKIVDVKTFKPIGHVKIKHF